MKKTFLWIICFLVILCSVRFVSASEIESDPNAGVILLKTVLFQNGYNVNVSVDYQQDYGCYDFSISSNTYYIRDNVTFIGICCSAIGRLTKITTYRTMFLFMSCNDQIYCIETEDCRKALELGKQGYSYHYVGKWIYERIYRLE